MVRNVPTQLRNLIAKYQETKNKRVLEQCIVILYKMLCNIVRKKVDMVKKYEYDEIFAMGYTALIEAIEEWDLNEDLRLIGTKINQKIDKQLKDENIDELVKKHDYRYRGKDIREDIIRQLKDLNEEQIEAVLTAAETGDAEKIPTEIMTDVKKRLRPLIRLYGLNPPKPRIWWRRMTVGV